MLQNKKILAQAKKYTYKKVLYLVFKLFIKKELVNIKSFICLATNTTIDFFLTIQFITSLVNNILYLLDNFIILVLT